jgi:hypothetical protein
MSITSDNVLRNKIKPKVFNNVEYLKTFIKKKHKEVITDVLTFPQFSHKDFKK